MKRYAFVHCIDAHMAYKVTAETEPTTTIEREEGSLHYSPSMTYHTLQRDYLPDRGHCPISQITAQAGSFAKYVVQMFRRGERTKMVTHKYV